MSQLARIFTKKNLVWFLFMLLFTATCFELGGRYYLKNILHKSPDQKFRFNSYRIYEHVPGYKESDGQKTIIEINAQGFRRSTEVSLEKPKNTYRIFLMGGSAAHGISSSAPYPIVHLLQNETIDAQLEKLLKQKYPLANFEVINAAVTGYETFQHTAYILSELLNYNPDLIIFFDGNNDHFINNPLYNPYKDKEYKFWEKRLQHPSIKGHFDYFMLWLSNYSAFARGYIAYKMQKDAIENEGHQSSTIKHSSDKNAILNHKYISEKTYLRSIETNLTILKNNNIQSLISLQPILALRNKDLLSSEENSWFQDDKNIQLLYPNVVNQLEKLSKKHNTPFVDFNPIFNASGLKNKQLFIDYCHLNVLGSETVAKELFLSVDSLYKKSLVP